MSDNGNDSSFDGDGLDPKDFEAFMREFLEKGASGMDVEKLAAAAGLPNDPAQLAAMLSQLRSALNQSNPDGSAVNWKLASEQARQLAAANSIAVSDDIRKQLNDALAIANLWLNQATQVSDLTQEPKMLSRELWVQDAMPLFQALSSPVAERMSVALSESLQANAPEELSGVLGNATSMMRSMGGALFCDATWAIARQAFNRSSDRRRHRASDLCRTARRVFDTESRVIHK